MYIKLISHDFNWIIMSASTIFSHKAKHFCIKHIMQHPSCYAFLCWNTHWTQRIVIFTLLLRFVGGNNTISCSFLCVWENSSLLCGGFNFVGCRHCRFLWDVLQFVPTHSTVWQDLMWTVAELWNYEKALFWGGFHFIHAVFYSKFSNYKCMKFCCLWQGYIKLH